MERRDLRPRALWLLRAKCIGRQLKVGSIWYNSEQLVLPETAWGGFKRRGIGR